MDLQRGALGRGGPRGRDVVQFGHLRQHLVASLPGCALVAERVVFRGRLRQPREQRRLLEVQLRGRPVEEDARCRLDADRGLPADGAVGDAVEVAGEDRALGVVFVVVDRQLGLDDLLAQRVLVAAQIQVAHELHRDRRAALQWRPVDDVLDGRAEYAGEVDAVVLVEPLILDRDRRVLQIFGDLAPADRTAHLGRLNEPQARAVGGEHLRGAAVEQGVQQAQRRGGVGDVQHIADRRDRAEHEHRREHAAADEQDACWAGAVVPAPALPCLPGHRSLVPRVPRFGSSL